MILSNHLHTISDTTDPGILRATKIKSDATIPADEPSNITPLLYLYIKNYIVPKLDCNSYHFDNKVLISHEESWGGTTPPRPIDRGWWGAFGHVEIDAKYSNTIAIKLFGYLVSTNVEYTIEDKYEWFPNKKTPFGPPLASSTIWIPHEWELSLVPSKATMFNFSVTWKENLTLQLAKDFAEFSILGEQRNIPLQ